jgi:hypothetical protein
MLERSFQLRARLRENKETARIPLKQSALTQYQERPYQNYADMFDTAPPQYQGGEQGSSSIPTPRTPLDHRLQEPPAKGKRPLEGGTEDEVKPLNPNATTLIPDLVSRAKARACPNTFRVSVMHSFLSSGVPIRKASTICNRNFLYLISRVSQFPWMNWKPFWGQHLPRTTSLVPTSS